MMYISKMFGKESSIPNLQRTPSLTARLRATASSESNPDPATGELAEGMDPLQGMRLVEDVSYFDWRLKVILC